MNRKLLFTVCLTIITSTQHRALHGVQTPNITRNSFNTASQHVTTASDPAIASTPIDISSAITHEKTDIQAEIQSIRTEFESIKASDTNLLEQALKVVQLNEEIIRTNKELTQLNREIIEVSNEFSRLAGKALDLLIPAQRALNNWQNAFAALTGVTIVSLFANILLGCCLSHHHSKADSAPLDTPAAPKEEVLQLSV